MPMQPLSRISLRAIQDDRDPQAQVRLLGHLRPLHEHHAKTEAFLHTATPHTHAQGMGPSRGPSVYCQVSTSAPLPLTPVCLLLRLWI